MCRSCCDDISRVSIGAAPQTGIFGLNDRVGGVEGIVLMRRWENPSEVLNAIHDAVDDLNANRLPPGVRIVPIHDRTELVANTLRTIGRALTEALVIVVFVLSLTLGSVRAALLTAVTIPLSLLFAFICMYAAGIPANLLSLGAIDFGIIVDGNLVMVQHILRRLAERERAPRPRTQSTRRSGGPRSRCSGRSCSRWSSSSPRISRCSRWSASSGGCSRRWHTPSASRWSVRCC